MDHTMKEKTTPNSNLAETRLTIRQRRAIKAMKSHKQVSRELLDSITGSSNSPDVIHQLRCKLGNDAIETKLVDGVDCDGKRCQTGRYSLTEIGHQRVVPLGF